MSAFDVLKQSVHFYRLLFSKIILISTVSNALPLLFGAGQSEMPLPLVAFILLSSVFCTAWLMVFVYRFSQYQDSSLKASASMALEKLFPLLLTFIVMGFALTIFSLPAAIFGALLGSGLQDETAKTGLMLLCMLIPILFLSYRWFLAPYATLVDGLQPLEAIKRSNRQVRSQPLLLRGFILVSVIMAIYTLMIIVLQLMIAVNPVLIEMAKFAVNVVVGPIITIYVYRLFEVTRPSESGDARHD